MFTWNAVQQMTADHRRAMMAEADTARCCTTPPVARRRSGGPEVPVDRHRLHLPRRAPRLVANLRRS